MNFENLLPVVLILYLPFYVWVVISTASKVKHYSDGKKSISYLGTLRSKKHTNFNLATIIYGLLVILFSTVFKNSFLEIGTSETLVTAQLVMGIFLILVALVPTDAHYITHQILGGFLFGASLVVSLELLKMSWPNWLYDWFFITNIVFVVVAFAFAVDAVYAVTRRPRRVLHWKLEWMWGIMMALNFTSLAFNLLLN